MTSLGDVATKLRAQPLLLAQAFYSAASALGMVMAAMAMAPAHFTTFSLLIAATQICTDSARALLFQPALIETRSNKNAHIHLRVALLGALCASIGFLIAAVALGIHKPLWLAVLSIANASPMMAEWLRMRAMALDERWTLVRADAIRLVAMPSGALVLWSTTETEVFTLFVYSTYLTTVLYLALCLPSVPRHLSPLRFWRSASSQLADVLMAHGVSTAPLLILAGFGSSTYIGGIRMAQTLLGPINLLSWASTMNLLADGATQDSHSKPADLIRHGRRTAAIICFFSFAIVAIVLVALLTSGFSFRGVENKPLTIGVLLVGGVVLTSGFSYIDVIVMRLLGHHTIATFGRAFVVIATCGGYIFGYIAGGVDMSLIVAFCCAAVANPLGFVLPAKVVYRRYLRSDG